MFVRRTGVPFMLVILGVTFTGPSAAQQPAPRVNPLLQPSTLPYGVPRFDQIQSADFRAAFDQGMREELGDIERIAAAADLPTFANTMEALERSGELMRRTTRVLPAAVRTHQVTA
jgi:peptidyl-dipeptidase Dcp